MANNSVNYINSDTLVCPGVYNDSHVVINASNIFFACNDSLIDGFNRTGTGINVTGRANVNITSCNVTRFYNGIWALDSNYTLIQYNVIYNTSSTAVETKNMTGLIADSNNISIVTAGTGIGCTSTACCTPHASSCTFSRISNNNIYQVNRDGVYVTYANLTNITGNYIANPNITSFNEGMGISRWSYNTTVRDNIIINGTWEAIYFYQSSNCSAINNTILNHYYGINALASSQYNLFENNTVSNSNNYGYYFDSTSGNNIISNSNDSNNTWDYYIQNSANNTVNGARIGDILMNFLTNGAYLRSAQSAPPTPAGNISLNKYLNITNTTASSWVFVNISYNPVGINESTVTILKYNGSVWMGANSAVDLANYYVYANLTNFSVFGVFSADNPPGVTNMAPADSYYEQRNESNESTALLNFTYYAVDDVGLSYCELFVDNGTLLMKFNDTSPANGTNNDISDQNVTANVNNSWYMSCVDSSGQRANSSAWSFYANTTNSTEERVGRGTLAISAPEFDFVSFIILAVIALLFALFFL